MVRKESYTVPPGQRLKLWEGQTASQQLSENSPYILEGGAIQIVLEPRDLQKSFISERRATGWGYKDEIDPQDPFLGVPHLVGNWAE